MSDRDTIQRSILPIPDAQHVGLTTYDAKDPDTKFPPIEPLRPPKGAPNVLVILIDDCGFGASSAFGGPIATPNAERLAENGLKFNRFHTTALCSPTRQALLTGRNHHSVNMGGICEIATSAPGYTSVLPKNKAPLAMTLKLNGYSTAQFGKCHEVPVWETSPMGPFDQWPTGGGGFEYFYGFIGGETNQWYPAIYEGTTPMEQGKSPEEGYHFTEDMTNKAIGWVRQQKALMPDKPFFMYFAPGATHAPHHVPKEWIDKYKGKFDGGWDKLREETFARQKTLGVIPADAVLTKRPDEIPAYDDMPAALKPILAREMEVYAGFLEHTDHHVGRLLDTLKDLEILDDTLIYYIFGDNGASAEGTLNGCFNEVAVLNGMSALETPEFLMSKIDDFGGPDAYNHYAVGWAHAMNTPYQWTKQVASHFGGTRNGTIVHWPNGIKAKDEIRSQFCHVIDIAPTVLEAAGIPAPTIVNSVQQAPYEGASMLYAFNDAKAAERRETQYFEMFCNRGIYHKGWTAVTRHGVPWLGALQARLRRRRLGALRHQHRLDPVEGPRQGESEEAGRAAAAVPDRGDQVQRSPARRSHLRALQRGPRGPTAAHQGQLADPVRRHVPVERRLAGGDAQQVVFADRGDRGAEIRRQRRHRRAGRQRRRLEPLRAEGKLKHCYNFFGIERFFAEGKQPIPPASTRCAWSSSTTAAAWPRAAPCRSSWTARKTARAASTRTVPMVFSADETCDVGKETGSPVSPDYGPTGNEFSGKVNWVQIDLEKDDHDHLISPEERFRDRDGAAVNTFTTGGR